LFSALIDIGLSDIVLLLTVVGFRHGGRHRCGASGDRTITQQTSLGTRCITSHGL